MDAGEAGEGPLTCLAGALCRARPFSLSTLVTQLEDVEAYHDFVRLVDEYLPDQRQDIISDDGSYEGMVEAFSRHFSQRYFPLADHVAAGDIESLTDLMHFIPIDVYGYEYDEYHELCSQSVSTILSSLLVDFEDELGLEGEGIRVTLLEAAAQHVSQELLGHIPGQGYSLDFLEQTLGRQAGQPTAPGTEYEGLLDYARHLCVKTKNVFLDTDRETFMNGPPDWDRETVDWLTQEWKQAKEMLDRQGTYFNWLGEDLKGNFARLLACLGAIEPPPPPEQMRLL